MIADSYHWLKALHIIAVISWMAGMLYLPRLFAYHATVSLGSDADVLLQTMERRLMRAIMLPAMLATFVLGFWLALSTNAFSPTNGMWLHVKVTLVLVLAGMHGMMSRWRKRFVAGQNTRSSRFYKIFNEAVTVLMIAIVLLVVLQPF